jgi:hypothetical protein
MTNKFVVEGDICIISLFGRRKNKIAETIIDVEDYEKCKFYKWCGFKDRDGNIRVINSKAGYLSNFVMDFKPTRFICTDHIDGNTLNNRRKTNLQICTMQQNLMKSKLYKNNSSGYRGVCWDKTHNKWVANVQYNYKSIRIGSFFKKEEAALAYNVKAIELFGEFAILNDV